MSRPFFKKNKKIINVDIIIITKQFYILFCKLTYYYKGKMVAVKMCDEFINVE